MKFTIRQATWKADKSALIRVRTEVFINEQLVPPDLEWDGRDKNCWHVVAETPQGEIIATARMLFNGHIGRMAVLPEYRHQGIGCAMLKFLLGIATEYGIKTVVLNAQTGAVDFYRKQGFTITSDEFMDAGIPHVRMSKKL